MTRTGAAGAGATSPTNGLRPAIHAGSRTRKHHDVARQSPNSAVTTLTGPGLTPSPGSHAGLIGLGMPGTSPWGAAGSGRSGRAAPAAAAQRRAPHGRGRRRTGLPLKLGVPRSLTEEGRGEVRAGSGRAAVGKKLSSPSEHPRPAAAHGPRRTGGGAGPSAGRSFGPAAAGRLLRQLRGSAAPWPRRILPAAGPPPAAARPPSRRSRRRLCRCRRCGRSAAPRLPAGLGAVAKRREP